RPKLAHRRFPALRPQQLHLALTSAHERRFEPVGLAHRSLHELRAERRRVKADRLVHVGHRDADVVDSTQRHCIQYGPPYRASPATEKMRVTVLRVSTFGSRPSIFRLPRSSFIATPRPT